LQINIITIDSIIIFIISMSIFIVNNILHPGCLKTFRDPEIGGRMLETVQISIAGREWRTYTHMHNAQTAVTIAAAVMMTTMVMIRLTSNHEHHYHISIKPPPPPPATPPPLAPPRDDDDDNDEAELLMMMMMMMI
jgi:hypothetical protein